MDNISFTSYKDDKDDSNEDTVSPKGQTSTKSPKPIVAKISLWTSRPGNNKLSKIDSDSGNDSDNESSDEEADHEADENTQLEQRLKRADLPDYVKNITNKELHKLKRTPSFMADYGITRAYLELIADLPWNISTNEVIDLKKARNQLNNDHYGLQKPKERVLQYLAIRHLKQQKNSTRFAQPILMFVGPPGTGKTSIAQSIASSLGRKFHRISLGGVADQSSIRGHRRTYVGAMPGRIIQGIKQTGVNNPVFLLDEIDKMGSGPQGDPSGALLEALDPEQNHTFTDHYLNVAFDLSKVLFVATANSLQDIPSALLDRLEIIQIPGYTHEEKLNIALRHLVPKQIAENGLDQSMIIFRPDALNMIISSYVHEAGVRRLERLIGTICRGVAISVVESRTMTGDQTASLDLKLPIVIDAKAVPKYLGPVVYESDRNSRNVVPGVVIGLAWTAGGGEITYVEAELMQGSPRREGLVLTGQLGSVMRESALLALNWIRANFHRYDGLPSSLGKDLNENTVHIHFPAGAVGKDGPSAGVTIVTALMSLCSEMSVIPDLAMTGEITLRGIVLKVGGVKSKVLAAHRAGIKRVILPIKNEADIIDIPREVKDQIKFYFASTIDDVIKVAFDGKLALSTPRLTEESIPGLTSKL